MHKLALSVACLIAAAILLVACGSGGNDESQIVHAIEASAVSSDPTVCTKFQTQNFVEQGSDEGGQAAVRECEKDRTDRKENARSARVSDVEVDGSSATANVAFTGGGFNGQTLTVALVKEGDRWKLDEATAFAKLDRAALIATLEKSFDESKEVSQGVRACIAEEIEAASKSAIEGLFLDGSSARFVELAQTCR